MPHKGKAYPWVSEYDTWIYTTGSLGQLAERYKCIATKDPTGGQACLNGQALTSAKYSRDATTGILKWHFEWPCSPVVWNFDLEYLIKSPLENYRWRYSLYNGATLVNRTIEITPGNPYGHPNVPGSPQWINPTGLGVVLFNQNPNPVPWPP